MPVTGQLVVAGLGGCAAGGGTKEDLIGGGGCWRNGAIGDGPAIPLLGMVLAGLVLFMGSLISV